MVSDTKVIHKSVTKIAKVVHKSVKYLYISFIFSTFAAKLSKQYKSNEIIDNVPLYASIRVSINENYFLTKNTGLKALQK